MRRQTQALNDAVRLTDAGPRFAYNALLLAISRDGRRAVIDHRTLTMQSIVNVHYSLDILFNQALADGIIPPGLPLAELSDENRMEIARAVCDSVVDNIIRQLSRRFGQQITLAPVTYQIWRKILLDRWRRLFDDDYDPLETVRELLAIDKEDREN